MSSDIVIKVENLTKIYKLYNSSVDRLKEALSPIRRKYHHDFHALHNISFEVRKGENIGVIGKNGSGKSTLLKILTGVLTPTSGTVLVNGKISALLELGAGFSPELSGVENVYFSGALMGYSRVEMDQKLDDILAFADIGEFVNQPVKTYSSGMFIRLAFAVAINIEPEILIVDEALSVGDVFFQQKCYSEIRRKIDTGITFLFVSHDIQAVRNLCRRCLMLHDGLFTFDGAPEEAASRYLATLGSGPRAKSQLALEEKLFSADTKDAGLINTYHDVLDHSILAYGKNRHGAGGIQLVAARVTNEDGRDTLTIPMLDEVHFCLLIRAQRDVYDPSVGIHLYDRLGNLVFAAGTRQLGINLPDLNSGQELLVKLRLGLNVQPGNYTFSLGVAEPADEGPNVGYQHDRWEDLGPLVVINPGFEIMPFYGIAQLPLQAETSLVNNI